MKIYFLLLSLMCFFSGHVSSATPSRAGGVPTTQIKGMSQEDTEFLQGIVIARVAHQSAAFKNYFTPKFARLSEQLRQNIFNQAATDSTIKQIQQLASQVRLQWKFLEKYFTDPDSITLDNYDPEFMGKVKKIMSEYAADLEKNKSALTQLQINRSSMAAQLASMRRPPNSPEIRQLDASIANVQSKIQSIYKARINRIEKIILDEGIPNVNY